MIFENGRYEFSLTHYKQCAAQKAKTETYAEPAVQTTCHPPWEIADGAVPTLVVGLLLVGHRRRLVHGAGRHCDSTTNSTVSVNTYDFTVSRTHFTLNNWYPFIQLNWYTKQNNNYALWVVLCLMKSSLINKTRAEYKTKQTPSNL